MDIRIPPHLEDLLRLLAQKSGVKLFRCVVVGIAAGFGKTVSEVRLASFGGINYTEETDNFVWTHQLVTCFC